MQDKDYKFTNIEGIYEDPLSNERVVFLRDEGSAYVYQIKSTDNPQLTFAQAGDRLCIGVDNSTRDVANLTLREEIEQAQAEFKLNNRSSHGTENQAVFAFVRKRNVYMDQQALLVTDELCRNVKVSSSNMKDLYCTQPGDILLISDNKKLEQASSFYITQNLSLAFRANWHAEKENDKTTTLNDVIGL